MARQNKKLQLELPQEDKVFIYIDKEDSVLANKHYGYYLIATLTGSQQEYTSSRLYLSSKHKQEYYSEKVKLGNNAYKKKIRIAEYSILDILDEYPQYDLFIKSAIKSLFPVEMKYNKIKSILVGIKYFIDVLIENNVVLDSVHKIEKIHQKTSYEFFKESFTKQRSLNSFFLAIAMVDEKFQKIHYKLTNKSKKTLNSIPSSIVYQLEKIAIFEIREIKKGVENYFAWIADSQIADTLSVSNLLKTLITKIHQNNYQYIKYESMLLRKLFVSYGVDAEVLTWTKKKIDTLSDLDLDKYYQSKEKLLGMAKHGKNIDIKNEEMFAIWTKELFPEWPHSKEIDVKYKNITKDSSKNFRSWMYKYFNINYKQFDSKIVPSNNDLYPFVLLILIKHGLNLEVLKSWKVKKDLNGKYEILGDEVGTFVVIDGIKNRSNSKIATVILNESFEKKCIDFYVEWVTPIYEKSGCDSLFQYVNNSGGCSKHYQKITNTYFNNIKNSPNSIYKRYEIFGLNGKKINFIEHRELRKSHNYQMYLQGKSEFERQIKKAHKRGETTKIFYENHTEWKDSKYHRIALTQNLVIGVFKGEITRKQHKVAELLNGPLANCSNNKEPTFNNAPPLKDNEYCSDWTKCLTMCDKSCVIPKIHGPVIYAWIKFMEEEKENFIRENDWEKEYLVDYESALNTIGYFTKEEIIFCKEKAHLHKSFVRMKFPRIIKIKDQNYA